MISEAIWMARHAKQGLRKTLRRWRGDLAAWRRFWTSYRIYSQAARVDRKLLLHSLYPCLGDDTALTPIEPVYFYQDAWAFEKIVHQRPTSHVDVGSHHKFVALLSKVVPVTMVDIRPLALPLKTVRFQVGSILKMPFEDGSVKSLSSICVVEHIGLGRYGDPLDPQGTQKAFSELKRVLAKGGDLYLSVPVDDENRT
jgi:SAM-dependent methyltransferase